MNNTTQLRVSDVMRQSYCLVDGLVTVAEGLAEMRLQGANALIIDKRDADDEYGLVLVSDIAKKVLAVNRAPERINVYEIMSKPLLSVPPAMKVHHCARLFDRFGLTMAPVVNNQGTILGIVSYEDLVLRGLVPG